MESEKNSSSERVSIFIDGNNFYYGCKDTIGTVSIDFEKFIKTLLNGRVLVDTYYYNALLDKNKDADIFNKQSKFFDELRKIGVKVTLCNVRKKRVDDYTVYTIKGDDVNLAVDMLTTAVKNSYDTAILVSGDGDFLPLVKAVKEDFGKKVENAIFRVNQSHDLRIICQPHIIYMDRFIKNCVRKNLKLPFFTK